MAVLRVELPNPYSEFLDFDLTQSIASSFSWRNNEMRGFDGFSQNIALCIDNSEGLAKAFFVNGILSTG